MGPRAQCLTSEARGLFGAQRGQVLHHGSLSGTTLFIRQFCLGYTLPQLLPRFVLSIVSTPLLGT